MDRSRGTKVLLSLSTFLASLLLFVIQVNAINSPSYNHAADPLYANATISTAAVSLDSLVHPSVPLPKSPARVRRQNAASHRSELLTSHTTTSFKKMKLKSFKNESKKKKGHSKSQQPNLVPRILVPEAAVYLPIYGPSLYNVFKIQILPPVGPIQTDDLGEVSSSTRSISKLEGPFRGNQIMPNEPVKDVTTNMKRELIPENRYVAPENFDDEFDILRKVNPKQSNRRLVPSLPPQPSRSSWEKSRQIEPVRPFTPTPRPVVRPIPPLSPVPHWSSKPPTSPAPKLYYTNYAPIRPRTLESVTRSSYFINRPPSTTSTTTTTTTTSTTTTRRPTVRATVRPTTRPPVSARKPKSSRNKQAKQADPLAADRCSASKCRLPHCNCASSANPGGMKPSEMPQMVMITFDDSINDLNTEIYKEIFTGRTNPNGCPILGTFYVSHEWTDYSQVQNLYSEGHEMASHSITHSFGEKFSKEKWMKEINGMREILHLYGGVKYEDIRGMRAPFLQSGGNNQFEMLYEANFTYDSSLPVLDNKPPYWPYTFDYALGHECMIPPCPTHSYPGLWEVGMVMLIDYRGGRCSMVDACSHPPTEEEVFENLLKNFNRHYKSNKAPFGLYFHSAWFNTQHYRRGFLKFIDHINRFNDVYFTTKWQMLQWMQQPTPLSRIRSFRPFQCNYQDRASCPRPTVCNAQFREGPRYLKTCQKCPKVYPWVGNTGFERKKKK